MSEGPSTLDPDREERTGYRRGDRSARLPDDQAGDASSNGEPVRCDLCGAAMAEVHCKLICTRCGYQRDCSDP